MKPLPLGYALDLCRLLALEGGPRFEQAAVRWHGRFVVERSIERLSESQLLLASLTELPWNAEDAEPVSAARPASRGRLATGREPE